MAKTNANKVTTNFLWRFMERCGAQGVTFIISVVLARLLDPDAYGVIALVTVFTSILQVFIDGGLGNALIQKKNADDTDFSSVFYANITVCGVLYLLMFFAAPLISSFYERPELTTVIRVLSLTIVISGVKNVQQAYVSKNLLFKRFFFATLGGTIGAAVIGIWMAYRGYGVWALVVQHLFNASVDTIILWATVKWRPKRLFSFPRLLGLFRYGWKLLVSSLLDTVYNNLRQLIIGKMYTSEDLAFYNKGKTFPNMFVTNINTSIDSVLLPVMSAEQDDKARVRDMTRRAIKTSTYLMMPIMMGLAVCAKPIVSLILTEKWLPCVPFLQIFCFTYAFYPIHTANLNAIKAVGRSDLFLILEIIKKVMGLVLIVSTMWISVEAMALSLVASSVISQIINSWPNKKLLGYSYLQQLRDLLPALVLTVVMGAVVYCVSFLPIAASLMLLIQVVLGVAIYLCGSIIFKLESYQYILNKIKTIIDKKKGK